LLERFVSYCSGSLFRNLARKILFLLYVVLSMAYGIFETGQAF
jgi:hypothetical protein